MISSMRIEVYVVSRRTRTFTPQRKDCTLIAHKRMYPLDPSSNYSTTMYSTHLLERRLIQLLELEVLAQ